MTQEFVHLLSPHNGKRLTPHAPYLLSDGELLWPVVEDIAYLRPRHDLRERAVALLQAEKKDEALLVLLQDQDRFAPLPPPDQETLRTLVGDENVGLREAMQMLNYGPVADYFAYRWATPTFLSGLALLQQTVRAGQPVVEIACGMGHFLSVLEANGASTVGVDLVFSKLWLARRYLGIQGTLICGDIEQAAPLVTKQSASVFCHDAFYFFEHKLPIIKALRALAAGGSLAVGHVHTNAVDHGVAGYPLAIEEYIAMASDDARFWDDTQLIDAWLHQEAVPNQSVRELQHSEAVAWTEGPINQALFPLDQPAAPLVRNPLLEDFEGIVRIQWPTERFQEEYEADAAYLHSAQDLAELNDPDSLSLERRNVLFRRRTLLDLPAQW